MSFKDTQALVVDINAGLCEAGFAGDDAPRAVFSSVVTHTRHSGIMFGANHEATHSPHTTREMITNELHVAPVDHPVLLTKVTLNPRPNRERTTQIVFETFNAPAIYVKIQPVLVLYASGCTTDCVIDSGDAVSFTMPVHEGYVVHDAIGRRDIGARGMTDLLMRILDSAHHGAGGGYLLKDSTIGSKTACDIREKLTYVTLAFDEELQAASQDPSRFEKSYALSQMGPSLWLGASGSALQKHSSSRGYLGKKRVRVSTCAPSRASTSTPLRSNKTCTPISCYRVTRSVQFFKALVAKELVALAPSAMSIKVVGPPENEYAVWRGGSILASLSSFQEMWISAAEYDEIGPPIVHRKCIN